MKKKASLLISGITTVAMLAVAVGSFAAWDKLDATTPEALTAVSASPAVLKVDKSGETDNVKIVPEGSLIASGEGVESTLGQITVAVKTEDSTPVDKSDKVDIKGKASVKADGSETENITQFKVLLHKKSAADATGDIALTGTDVAVAPGEYDVKIAYADGTNYDDAKDLKGKNLSVSLTFSATVKNS